MQAEHNRRKGAVGRLSLFFFSLLLTACQEHNQQAKDTSYSQPKEEKTMELQVSSSAFQPGEMIPVKHTCDGPDLSPPLQWTAPPGGTKSLALICDDPDAPVGTWVHWVLYGLSPETTSLPEAVPKDKIVLGGARQGMNDFRRIGYGGPCPPPGAPHRYFFKLYALDSSLDLEPGLTKQQLLDAMKGHILAQGQLMGKYKR